MCKESNQIVWDAME